MALTADSGGAPTGATMREPQLYEGCDTPQKLFWRRAREWGPDVALRVKRRGLWRPVTWSEHADSVRRAGLALLALGAAPGDTVSVLSENRPEWIAFDLGAQCVGLVGNGIYTTSSPEQVRYQLADSGSRLVLVESDEQLDKVLAVRERCPRLARIVLLERTGLRHFRDAQVLDWPAFLELGEAYHRAHPGEFEARVAATRADAVALLVYTSGTTGQPKGAMVTNRNLMFQIRHAHEITPMTRGDRTLSFLPLCHIAERNYCVYYRLAFGNVAHFMEDPATLMQDLCEVQPTSIFAPPRIWEKMYSAITLAMKDALPLARWAYARALAAGEAVAAHALAGTIAPARLRWTHRCLDLLALANVRKRIGMSRMGRAVTGAAPIAPGLIRWFLAIGVDLAEAYGATETTGLCTATPLGGTRPGSAGRAPTDSELRLGPDGEILVRGANVFAGYLGLEAQTRAAIDAGGWLHTGDVGELDANGYLRITDRIKDILITAGGKNVAPAAIETLLKASPYVSDAIVIGEARPYLTCLVMLDHDNVSRFAQDAEVPFTSFASLARAEPVRRLIEEEIARVNAQLSRVEQVKHFRIIDTLLTADDEELTPTMKLKRNLVSRRFAQLIEQMYA